MDSPTTTKVVYTDVGVVPEHDTGELEPTIPTLQAEISDLRSKQRSLYAHRKDALNKLLDIRGSNRVFCRVSSSHRTLRSPVSFADEQITVIPPGGSKKEFAADRLFAPDSTQDDVFREVEPVLRSALDGHNVCVFAYGQTGTGKTFTMEGTGDQPGIVPRAIEELFRRASEDESGSVEFSMSMLEVYMGSLRDLLARKQPSSRATRSVPKSVINILTGRNGSVEVEGLADVSVSDFRQAHRWYSKGKRARSTSWTNVNEASSRSHCLTRVTISRAGSVSKVWMVDLGGSERLLKTGATGQTLDEGRAINLSLSALADVIASLKMKRHHIPYRNSKLTQILSDSLGDGSKVLMIVHVSPNEGDVAETICSLNFAKRVRAIESNRELSEDTKKLKEKRIADLSRQIDEDAADLQKVRNCIERAEKLVREKKLEDQKGSPRSTLIVERGEIMETPRNSEKTVGRARTSSVPRFMTSTESSRQRLSACSEVNRRLRMSSILVLSQSLSYSEPCFKPNPRRPVLSQSLSYSEPCFKPNPRRPMNRNDAREAYIPAPSSINSKSLSFQNTKVSTSHPISRVKLQHHRRMSNLT